MKGVDEAGREVRSRGSEGPGVGGVLADHDVATLRAFVILVMKRGGVPIGRIAQVMRCGRSTLYRDALEPEPEA